MQAHQVASINTASKTARQLPPGFPDLLRDFSREVLRSFPRAPPLADEAAKDWILRFAAEYFASGGAPAAAAKAKRLTAATEAAAAAGSNAFASSTNGAHSEAEGSSSRAGVGSGSLEASRVAEQISQLFMAADKDSSGSLDYREFKTLVLTLAAQLSLPDVDAKLLMSLCDANADGLVQYAEFVPLALQMLQLIAAKEAHAADRSALQARALKAAGHLLVHGMTAEEMTARLVETFREVDQDQDGKLTQEELLVALQNNAVGLSRKDVNYLFAQAEVDAAGLVELESFARTCFTWLASSIARQLELSMTPWEEAAIAAHLISVFEAYDSEGAGVLPLQHTFAALRDSDLHLSSLQQHAILAEAPTDASGGVDYRSFASVAANFIAAIMRTQVHAPSADRLLELRATAKVNGNDRDALQAQLTAALTTVDTAGTGRAHVADVRAVLRDDLRMDERQVEALLASARVLSEEEDGTIDLGLLIGNAFDVLENLMEFDFVRSMVDE